MKTHLQLVNNILIRLREREVGTVNETPYSKLISLFINDSKEFVEAAWGWSALRETIAINTVNGTHTYTITATDSQSTVLDITNTTSKTFVTYRTANWFKESFLDTTVSGSPVNYGSAGADASGYSQIKLHPVPDAIYALTIDVVQRNGALVADGDTLKVPHLPVQTLAYAMALEERGEDGGMSAISAKALAQNFLSDAIALDTQQYPEELIWEAC